MIYPFSPTKLAGMDSAEPLTQKIASKGLVNSIRVYNFTPGFWQITNDYNVIIDIVPPWREKIMRVTDSQNYFATFQTTQPYFQTSAVNNTQYQFGYEFTKSKLMPIEIPLLSLVQVTGSLPAGSARLGTVGLTGQGLPRYTFDQLLVDNVPTTVAAGTTYYSAPTDLHGLNWMAAVVNVISGTSLSYDIGIASYVPLVYGISGGNNPFLSGQTNTNQSGSGASSTGGSLSPSAQMPTSNTQAIVANNNTTDSLTFSYLEIVGG